VDEMSASENKPYFVLMPLELKSDRVGTQLPSLSRAMLIDSASPHRDPAAIARSVLRRPESRLGFR
jgi:hypothetical protein